MTLAETSTNPRFDLAAIRADFPILSEVVHGHPLVYLDNAATTQKPRVVIDSMVEYYTRYNANIHRGVHTLSQRATAAFEGARDIVARFLGATSREEIVFLRGTTEAVNLVAQTFARPRLSAGDEILITGLEHHSNIVPWQILREQTGCILRVAPIDERGGIDLDELRRLIGPRTRLVSVAHVSNALGTVNPVQEIATLAQKHGVPVFVDGAQAAAHIPLDVNSLGCDFYAISGHKLYGPTGSGALWARREILETMPPYHGGGEMIATVTFEKSTYNRVPHKFEAGTPNICGMIGLGAAIEYLTSVGLSAVASWEDELLRYGTARLAEIPGVRILGTAPRKAGILSFTMEGAHPHDIGTILDQEGIAIRAGHHCAQPVMDRFGVPATARASFAMYNTRDEVDALVDGIHRVREIFG